MKTRPEPFRSNRIRLARNIPFIATLSLAVAAVYAFIGQYGFSGISLSAVLHLVLGFVFIGTALMIRRKMRVALLLSAVVALFVLVFDAQVTLLFWAEPSVFPPFIYFVVEPPLSILVIASSLAMWSGMKTPPLPTAMGKGGLSALLAFAVIGFVIGALVIGAFAATTETRLLASSSTTADITIVSNAAAQGTAAPFSPVSFTVKVGATVTWVNRDSSVHTVTSLGSSLFDSGNIPAGGTYSYTFSQPGTYQYYCTLHPWMKGTVVVTA
jgi:plastocyanin